jgi:group I intron endonuclease
MLKKGNHENPRLQNACNKYGIDNFVFEILEYCEKDEKIIGYWERYYKLYYSAKYNIREIEDSNLGVIPSEETRKKWSEQRTGRKMSEEQVNKQRERMMGNQYTLGHKESDETKQKKSDSLKYKPKNRAGKSGYKGIVYQLRRNHYRWVVRINYMGKRISIGTFKTLKSAIEAYNNKMIELYQEKAILQKIRKEDEGK